MCIGLTDLSWLDVESSMVGLIAGGDDARHNTQCWSDWRTVNRGTMGSKGSKGDEGETGTFPGALG